MRIVAFIAAAVFALFGVGLIASAWNSEAGMGPVELFIGLIPIGIAVLLVRSVDVPIKAKKTCPDCRADVPDEARVCRHCGYEFWSHEGGPSHTASAGPRQERRAQRDLESHDRGGADRRIRRSGPS
jgi:rubredoxin